MLVRAFHSPVKLLMSEIPVPEPLEPYMPIIVAIVSALAIFIIGWLLSKWVHRLVSKALRGRKYDRSLVRFLASLAQVAVLAVTVITALAHVGIQTTSLLALLGTAGLAIGLALQGNLAHFASGVLILVFRPFSVDDYVEAGGRTGTVFEVGLFATTLTTPENHRVIVPNGSITSNPIVNYTTLGRRRASIDVGVGYGTDIEGVVELLLDAARACDMVLADPAPGASFVGMGASSLDFKLLIWTENEHFFPAQHAVRKDVYDRLNAAGIDIPFNQIVVHQAQ